MLYVPGDARIVLHLFDLDLEPPTLNGQCHDFLSVETPESEGRSSIRVVLCGKRHDYSPSQQIIQSSANWANVTFHTDHVVQGQGFNLTFRGVPLCMNRTYVEENGTISSANFPSRDLDYQRCYTIISMSHPNVIIQLQSHTLDTEFALGLYGSGAQCESDYVEITGTFREETNSSSPVQRFCGHWEGREYKLRFKSTSNIMIIHFVTNGNVHGIGYQATWQALPGNISNMQCPDIEWISQGEGCYRVFNATLKTWTDAQLDCEEMGSVLARITDINSSVVITEHLE